MHPVLFERRSFTHIYEMRIHQSQGGPVGQLAGIIHEDSHQRALDAALRCLSRHAEAGIFSPGDAARLYDTADGTELGEGPWTWDDLRLRNLV